MTLTGVLSASKRVRLIAASIWLMVAWAGVGGLGSCPAAEQLPLAADYMVRNWQTEDGLPQNTVMDILQTRDGYLWLGTFNGLVRFDGVRFTTFNLANSPEMGSDSVVCLYEDHQGQMWIGTDCRGLTRYFQGQFTNYVVTNRPGASLVSCVTEDETGLLWVGTTAGLFRLVSGHLEYFEPTSVPGGFGPVHQLCCDHEGQLWISAERGLFVRSRVSVRRVPEYEGLTKLSIGADGGVWTLNKRSGLVRWKLDQALPQNALRTWQEGDFPNSVLVCRKGDIWFCANDGLTRIRGTQRTRYALPAHYGSALSVFEDREENIWVGVNGGGLLRLHETVLQTISTRQGLPDNDVIVLMEESPGRVWIGGFGLGIGVWENGRFAALPELPYGSQNVYALARGADQRVWLGPLDGRLLGWENGRLFQDEKVNDELGRVLFVSKTGDLWVGSRYAGVEQRPRDKGPTTRYALTNGLSDLLITAIAQDREGAIWVGTKHGLNRIHQGRITRFYREQGLGSDSIHTLLVDHEGRLWVGTVGGGLSVAQGDRFLTIGTKQGLANDVIAQILEDGHGSLWLGSNGGIMRVDREELLSCARGERAIVRCRTFDRNDGMLNSECAGSFQPSCFKAQDGRLWFATVGGAVIIDPNRLTINSNPPPIVVESVLSDGVPCRIISGRAQPPRAQIPAGTIRVQVNYAGLSFAAPEDLRFQFRLDNLDADWIEAGPRRVAYFNRLRPGDYVFRVRACNNDGAWNEAGTSIRLEVEAFWWQILRFQIAVAVGLAAGAVGLTWRLLQRQLRRKLERAERHSAELRAAELGAANCALQARTEELETALSNVKTLRGLIPICSGCKKIRDDKGYWEQVEMYVGRHSDAKFTHGLCPACTDKFFPGCAEEAKLPGAKHPKASP
ncbi:MAG: triple tyrosine motif-containing protein [Verrucomicrobia bacterium]|nr:triple tyrosine motif-containing protein [Verrucomicrobiota bacterium]